QLAADGGIDRGLGVLVVQRGRGQGHARLQGVGQGRLPEQGRRQQGCRAVCLLRGGVVVAVRRGRGGRKPLRGRPGTPVRLPPGRRGVPGRGGRRGGGQAGAQLLGRSFQGFQHFLVGEVLVCAGNNHLDVGDGAKTSGGGGCAGWGKAAGVSVLGLRIR